MKMPAPTDIAALKRILGMVGYLAKFLPHLSDVCEPLRQQEPDNTRADNESAQLRAQDVTSPPRSVPPVAASPRRNEPPVNVHSPMNVPTSPRQSPRDATVARSGRLVKQPIKFKDYNMT